MRINRTNVPFTQISNALLYDKNLSWKAKGVFAYIYSKPDDYDFSTKRMEKDSNDGIKTLLSAIKELEDNQYLVRKKMPSGRMEYVIAWEPKGTSGSLPKRQTAEKASISNTDIYNNTDTAEHSSAMSKKQKNDEPMNTNQFIEWCRKSNQKHIQIIGEWAEGEQTKHETYGQWQSFIKRNLRVASRLIPYPISKIEKAYQLMAKDIEKTDPITGKKIGFIKKYGLETVEKYIDLV